MNTPRPAVLDALLDHVAANLPDEEQHPADDEQPHPHPGTCGRALSTGEPCPDHPAAEQRVAILDGRDALAFVIIRPADDDPDRVTVEAGSRGMSKAAAAYVLRTVADEFDDAATAEGDEPIPYGPAATLSQFADALDEHARRHRERHPEGEQHAAYRAGLRVAARIVRTRAAEGQQ
jgi:hypothetical protein